jgi:hypothetical protein
MKVANWRLALEGITFIKSQYSDIYGKNANRILRNSREPRNFRSDSTVQPRSSSEFSLLHVLIRSLIDKRCEILKHESFHLTLFFSTSHLFGFIIKAVESRKQLKTLSHILEKKPKLVRFRADFQLSNTNFASRKPAPFRTLLSLV